MTRPLALIAAALAALALASCGDDSDDDAGRPSRGPGPPATATQSVGEAPIGAQARDCEPQRPAFRDLRATGLECAAARVVMFAWARSSDCRPSGSRSACSVRGYRCLSAKAAAGGTVSVNCAQPARSLAFLVRPTPK